MPAAEKDYYVLPVLLGGTVHFLLWFSGEDDGVWTEGQAVLGWASEGALRASAASHGVRVSDEQTGVLSLDDVGGYVDRGAPLAEREKLGAWNLFSDVAASIEDRDFQALDRASQEVYDHLFFNDQFDTFGMQRPGPLSVEEEATLRTILAAGLAMIVRGIRRVDG